MTTGGCTKNDHYGVLEATPPPTTGSILNVTQLFEAMSVMMTMTLARPPADGSLAVCPNCGTGLESHIALAEAQKQIEDLQAQVRLLNQKATAAGP